MISKNSKIPKENPDEEMTYRSLMTGIIGITFGITLFILIIICVIDFIKLFLP